MTQSTHQSLSVSNQLVQQTNNVIHAFNSTQASRNALAIEQSLETLHDTAEALALPVADSILISMAEYRLFHELTPIKLEMRSINLIMTCTVCGREHYTTDLTSMTAVKVAAAEVAQSKQGWERAVYRGLDEGVSVLNIDESCVCPHCTVECEGA